VILLKNIKTTIQKSNKPEEKLGLSCFLIRLQDEDALAYYILNIKRFEQGLKRDLFFKSRYRG